MVIHLIHGWDVAEWLEHLTAKTEVAAVLGSISASSDTVESEGRQTKQCWIQYIHKKSPCLIMVVWWGLCPSACWWASCETPPTWWPRPCRDPPPPASPATTISTGGHQKKKENICIAPAQLFFIERGCLSNNGIGEWESSLGRYVFGSEISYNKPPPRLPGLAY